MKTKLTIGLLATLITILAAFVFLKRGSDENQPVAHATNGREQTIGINQSLRLDLENRATKHPLVSADIQLSKESYQHSQATAVALHLEEAQRSSLSTSAPLSTTPVFLNDSREKPGPSSTRHQAGTAITGRVLIAGDLPTEKSLPLDPICFRIFNELYSDSMPSTRFFVSEEGGLGDVLVTLIDVEERSSGPQSAPFEIHQIACQFTPYISAVQTGQNIRISNLDPSLHTSVVSTHRSGNTPFSATQLPESEPFLFSFNEPEEFLRIKCDVHPWMFAYVSVVDHPYYTISDPNGEFTIAGIPPGKYQIKAKHRKLGESIQEIEVRSDAQRINFHFTTDKPHKKIETPEPSTVIDEQASE